MSHLSRYLAAVLAVPALAAASVPSASAAEASSSEAAIRQEIEAIWAEARRPADPNRPELRAFHVLTDRLIALGRPAIPYIAAELDLPSVYTFNVAAYAAGHIGGPEAIAALRKALERAEADGGKWGQARKVWAVIGLALAGTTQALRALEEGLDVWEEQVAEDLSLLEYAALVTYPDSLPVLLQQLETLPGREDRERMLIGTLRALARFAEPSTLKHIVPFLEYPHRMVRAQAARTLGYFNDPGLVKKLVPLLKDEDIWVRRHTALAIEQLPLGKHKRTILAQLETLDETDLRAPLYTALARTGDEALVEAFRSHWGRPDASDRLAIVRALERLDTPRALNLLRAGARDPTVTVSIAATRALGKLGTPGARDTLLALLRDPRWAVRQTAIAQLVALREMRAAPRIADMLVRGELDEPVVDMKHRLHIQKLGEALVAFGYTEPLAALRRALERQPETWVRRELEAIVRRLEIVAARGTDVEAWAAAAAGDDAEVRQLAYQRLAWIGDHRCVPALQDVFARVAARERVEILRCLAALALPEAAGFAEALLADPAYDTWEQRRVRSMGAWLARRIGGDRMAAALEASARRRNGRDVDVLVYLAILKGRAAAPLIQELRFPRMRHLEMERGLEDWRLLWIVRELTSGRSIAELDAPPDQIAVHPW